jgi:type I restriction enzyme S subunit
MSEWVETSLAQLVTFQKGRKVDTSSFAKDSYVAYLGASGIEGRDDGYADPQFGVIAKPTDILMLWDGERSGLVGFGQQGVVASTVAKLSPNDKVVSQYLYFSLLSKFDWIQHRRTGTGVPHVPKDLGRLFRVRYPANRSKQQKIANILSTIDTVIEQTEALIEKYQRIKAGLMQDLFTRGVLPNGQLRPPREQAPELYQETAIGWVPKEWEIVRMVKLAEDRKGSTTIGPFGSDLVATDYQQEGVPIVFVRDVKESGFEWNSNTYVSRRKASQLAAHKVAAGDVLASKMGLPPCISCLYPDWMPDGVITADMIRLSPDKKTVNGHWLTAAINQDRVKRQIAAITAGVTRPKVTLADFRNIRIAKPPLAEQNRISDRLKVAQSMLDTELVRASKLETQKLGLMQDLLTGKVPVVVEAEAQEPVDA